MKRSPKRPLRLRPSLLRNSNVREWVSLMLLLAVSVFTVNYRYETESLFTSITGVEEHDPFDGTVLPIQEAPNWSQLSSAEYQMSYQELPSSKLQDIPEYRLDYLTYDSSKLTWGNAADEVIRNTKITYPVPYAGNYELDDCGENCGSHPAVDIKVPEGTPVYGIANGVVSKAGTSSSFGKYIVIKHNDVPDPNQPGKTTTLYSSYSHLSEFFVTEGQEVHKGDRIGLVGDTGTATTYHLHFQIDNAQAPWHPYWPFTTAEANAAGYSFWDAVNYKVGQDNLYRYTINPLQYVQSYLDEDAILTDTSIDRVLESTETTEEAEEEVLDEVSSLVQVGFSDLSITMPSFVMPGQNEAIVLELLDENGEVDPEASFEGSMTLRLSDESIAKLNRSSLTMDDFEDGRAEIYLYGDHEGEVSMELEVADRVYSSSTVYVISNIEPFASFRIESDGFFVPNKAETVRIQAVDLAGNPTPKFDRGGTLELSFSQGSGSFSVDELSKEDFTRGVVEITFTATEASDVVIQIVYGNKTIQSEPIQDRLFSDVEETDEHYTALSYLVVKGTVEGYPDGSFKPDNTVSRVEALKFIFRGLDQDVDAGLSLHFSDTSTGQWYSDILATAASIQVVEGYPDGSFKPTQGVNRVEFLAMLFRTVDVSVDPVVGEDPFLDVNSRSWYAPYVQYAKEKNIFPTEDYFHPGDPMSRIEVAEVIYRMLMVQANNGEPYQE